jgi:AAA domain
MELPKQVVKATNLNPRRLFIFSQPKVGKTTLLSKLPKALLIDLESGSDFVDAIKVKANSVDDLRAISKAIKEENAKLPPGMFAYDYIVIDTVTALEDMVKPLALELYQKTPMGKAYKGNILNLPNGAGYGYLREAFERVYAAFDGQSKCLILLGHIKKASILKDGKELAAKDIDLTGKLKSITAANMDAIGYLYRRSNQCILSFKTSEEDLATGARPPHLKNQEFVMSEDCPDKGFQTFWERVFVPEN